MSNTDFLLIDEVCRLRDGFAMEVSIEQPKQGASRRASILLLSPIFGVDAVFSRTMREWAAVGYRAIAPDYFARVFPGPVPHTDEGFRKAIGRVKAVDRELLLVDLKEIASRFANDGPFFVGGYCAGGEPALRLAIDGIGRGCVIFHAARLGHYSDRLAKIASPLDIHFGGADTLVPMEEVERVRAGAAGNPNISITIHPNAVHGFTQDGSRNFQREAAASSFAAARTVDQAQAP
jgi:carboxymethylenebutenolidase